MLATLLLQVGIISVGVTCIIGERVTDYALMSCTCLFLLHHTTIYLHTDTVVSIAFVDWLDFWTSRSSSGHKRQIHLIWISLHQFRVSCVIYSKLA